MQARMTAGTVVTYETFTAWAQGFRAETLAKSGQKVTTTKGAVTGRQMFRDNAEKMNSSDTKLTGADEVAVDVSLFQDLDLSDLDTQLVAAAE